MRTWWIVLLAFPVLAASPPKQLSLAVPQNDLAFFGRGTVGPASQTPGAGTGTSYAPAPLPNRDVTEPTARASTSPSLSPSLFSRADQYRGEGFSPNSSSQTDQDKRAKPAAGFSLHMPLTGE